MCALKQQLITHALYLHIPHVLRLDLEEAFLGAESLVTRRLDHGCAVLDVVGPSGVRRSAPLRAALVLDKHANRDRFF